MNQLLANYNNGANKQLERAKRQVILMRIIEDFDRKGKNPSFAKLAAKMRENSWIASRWPDYSHTTAHKDHNELMELTRDDIKLLAIPYFAKQVTTLDKTIDTLAEFVNDDNLPEETRIKAANTLKGLNDQSIRVFGNYAPKETHIKQQNLSGTLDDYMRLKEEARKEMLAAQEDIIDGETVD